MEEDGEWEGLREYANMWSTPASTLQPNSRRSSELGNTSSENKSPTERCHPIGMSLTGLEVNNPSELSQTKASRSPPPGAPPLTWLHLHSGKARSSARARVPHVVTPSTPHRSTRYLVAFDPEIGRPQEGEQGSQKRGI